MGVRPEDQERGRERVVVNATVHGSTLDEIVSKSTDHFNKFFEKHPWEFIEIKARPGAQAMGGEIFLWEADVDAAEVFV